MHMLCRNKVEDYEKWFGIFSSHDLAQRDSGLKLLQMWRDHSDSNDVWFIFEVTDADKANAFISSPDAQKAGKESGVIDGEYHFLNLVSDYPEK